MKPVNAYFHLLKITFFIVLFALIIYQVYYRVYNVYISDYDFYTNFKGYKVENEVVYETNYDISLFSKKDTNNNNKIIYKSDKQVYLYTLTNISLPIYYKIQTHPIGGFLLKSKNVEIFLEIF